MPQQQNSSSPFLISDSERGSYDYAGMTPDEAQAQRSIAQRRQMAKLMMSQGMQQAGKRGGMVGNIYVKSSPMEGLSGMAQVGLGGLADYLLAKESANTTAEHKKLTEAAIKKYIEQTSDVPEVPGTPASAGSAATHTDSNLPDIIDASQLKVAIAPSMRGSASTDNNGRVAAALFDGMKNKYVPNMRSNVLEPHPRFSTDELNALSQGKEDDNSYMTRIGEMANEKDAPRLNAMPYQSAVDTPAVPPSLGTPGTPGVKRTREDIRRAGLEAFALGNPRLNQIVGHLTDLREKEEENRLRREDRIARDTQANLDRQAQAEALAGYRSLLEKQVQGGRKELKGTVSGDTTEKGKQQAEHDKAITTSQENIAANRNTAQLKTVEARNNAARNKAEALKPLPAPAMKIMASNRLGLDSVNTAIAKIGESEKTDKGLGAKNYLSHALIDRVDPKGAEIRALVTSIGGMKIHDLSGSAVSVKEFSRLAPYVPQVTDRADIALEKLRVFKEQYEKIQEEYAKTYREQGFNVPERSVDSSVDQAKLKTSVNKRFNPTTGKLE